MNQQQQNLQRYQGLENIYEILIFQGFKNLVFYQDFNDSNGAITERSNLNILMQQHRIHNIYGVSEGLKAFSQSFASEPIQNFRYFISPYFKYTIFENSSGLKIIMLSQTSDPQDYYPLLREIYYNGYLEFIKRNSFYKQGEPLDSPYFTEYMADLFSLYIKKQ